MLFHIHPTAHNHQATIQLALIVLEETMSGVNQLDNVKQHLLINAHTKLLYLPPAQSLAITLVNLVPFHTTGALQITLVFQPPQPHARMLFH
jgi:hypothetical protein